MTIVYCYVAALLGFLFGIFWAGRATNTVERAYWEANEGWRYALDCWRATINDLEAAQRRIAQLEAERAVIPGDEWKQ